MNLKLLGLERMSTVVFRWNISVVRKRNANVYIEK